MENQLAVLGDGNRSSHKVYTLNPPSWHSKEDAWVTSLSSDVFDSVKVLVKTRGQSDPPAAIQLQTLEGIASLTKEELSDIRIAVRAWAEENLAAVELEDAEDEDYDIEFHTVIVPPLSTSKVGYFFLVGNSDLDWEHGLSLALISKDGSKFKICDSSDAYEDFEVDEIDALEDLFD